jgi:hemoglobin
MTMRMSMAFACMLAATGCQSDKSGSTSTVDVSRAEPRTAGHRILGSPEPQQEDRSGPTLYERLGKEPGIRAIVGDLAERALKDSRVNFSREGLPREWNASPENADRFKEGMTRFIVESIGGPASYQGPDMRTAHRGMRISDAEFNALLQDAEHSLKRFNIPEPDRREFLASLEAHRRDIVEK